MSSAPDQYGVFGHPVNHSLSPFIHGLFARETQQDMTYRPYDVAPEEFATRVREFFAAGGRGLNVTLPHKIVAVEVVDELTGRAAHAAAVNTLAVKGEGLLGDNTDGAGLVRDLARQKCYKGLVSTMGAPAITLAHEHHPEAITLDIFLPDIEGWRVLARLKGDLATRHIPVCVISTDESRERAGAGVQAHRAAEA